MPNALFWPSKFLVTYIVCTVIQLSYSLVNLKAITMCLLDNIVLWLLSGCPLKTSEGKGGVCFQKWLHLEFVIDPWFSAGIKGVMATPTLRRAA